MTADANAPPARVEGEQTDIGASGARLAGSLPEPLHTLAADAPLLLIFLRHFG
jgi:hypothetical protein